MMFRTPPPELAMTLAEDHRRNLMASAGKRPTGGTGDRNRRSFLCVVVCKPRPTRSLPRSHAR